MQRRSLLRKMTAASLIGASGLAGCLNALNTVDSTCSTEGTAYTWCSPQNVTIDEVVDGNVYARVYSDGPRHGAREVVAINSETGNITWKYKSDSDIDAFSPLTVQAGVYIPKYRDEDGRELIALNMDGTERWVHEGPAGHRAPIVYGDSVYVANDRNIVQAIDTELGEQRWTHQMQQDDSRVIAVGDVVSIEVDHGVIGLAPNDGSIQWQYETPEQVLETYVSDEFTYIVTGERVIEVSAGLEQWSHVFNGNMQVGVRTQVLDIAAGCLVISIQENNTFSTYAVSVESGELAWTLPNSPTMGAIHKETLYTGDEQLRAVNVQTGSERWRASFNDKPIQNISMIMTGVETDRLVFVRGKNNHIAIFTPDGDQIWSHEPENADWVYPDDEYIYIGKKTGIFAIEPVIS